MKVICPLHEIFRKQSISKGDGRKHIVHTSSSLRYGSYQLHNVFGSARYLKYRNPT